jgi:hypothetical protein
MSKLNIPLSDADIKKYLPAELLRDWNGKLPCVVLYEKTPLNGHWSLILRTKNNNGKPCIEFFDSYGMKPDECLKIMNKEYKPKLVKWLLKNGGNISYNPIQYQKNGPIATCGRHCIMRWMARHLSQEQYKKRIDKLINLTGLDYDELSTVIVP